MPGRPCPDSSGSHVSVSAMLMRMRSPAHSSGQEDAKGVYFPQACLNGQLVSWAHGKRYETSLTPFRQL